MLISDFDIENYKTAVETEGNDRIVRFIRRGISRPLSDDDSGGDVDDDEDDTTVRTTKTRVSIQ